MCVSGQINPEMGKKHCAYYLCSAFFLLSFRSALPVPVSLIISELAEQECAPGGGVCHSAVSPCPECVSHSETSALSEWVLTRSRWERAGSVTVLSTLWNTLARLICTPGNTHSQLLMVHSSSCHGHCNPSLLCPFTFPPTLLYPIFPLHMSACIAFLC